MSAQQCSQILDKNIYTALILKAMLLEGRDYGLLACAYSGSSIIPTLTGIQKNFQVRNSIKWARYSH